MRFILEQLLVDTAYENMHLLASVLPSTQEAAVRGGGGDVGVRVDVFNQGRVRDVGKLMVVRLSRHHSVPTIAWSSPNTSAALWRWRPSILVLHRSPVYPERQPPIQDDAH